MNGFLMQEKSWVRGKGLFIESFSPENNYGVAFEEEEGTAYFYAVETDPATKSQRILDALHICQTTADPKEMVTSTLAIVWSRDWLKSALVIDGSCHAIFDFEKQGGYNINEFPPPNSLWTKQGRKLNNQLLNELF